MSITELSTNFAAAVADLASRVSGPVVTEHDAEYAELCLAWNLLFRHRPAMIVVPESTNDIVEAVRFARAAGLRVAIQATGHGAARPADDAVLISTHRLTDVVVDPVARTARIAAGAKWAAVLPVAQEHGLAPLLGSTTDVGAVGYTLGGGMGWLARRYGLASDSVRSFDLVTPDGVELHVSDDEHREIFFALKGGGAGSLGVVTAMEIDLYPVSEVYAGNLLYPIELARDVMRRWRDWAPKAGEALTSSVVVMNFPPLEIVPEPLRGKSFVMVRGCWSGELAAGQALIDEWREWQTPVMDMFGPMPFSMADMISQDPVDPMPAMVSTEWFDTLPDEAIDVVVRSAFPGDRAPTLAFAEIRHAGGAIRRNAALASSDRGRSGEFLLEMVGMAMTPHAGLALEAHLRYTRRALSRFVTGATYLNFTEGREKQERSATAFSPANLRRIAAVKRALDADDRFCHGVSITSA